MYLQLFLASVMITSTKGVTRIITPNFKAINFAKEIGGRRLNGSVIREVEVDSESSCGLQCVKENRCLSYNFGPNENKKRFKCQLSNSDRFVGLKNFTEDHEFLYRGIKVISFEGIKLNWNIRELERGCVITYFSVLGKSMKEILLRMCMF